MVVRVGQEARPERHVALSPLTDALRDDSLPRFRTLPINLLDWMLEIGSSR